MTENGLELKEAAKKAKGRVPNWRAPLIVAEEIWSPVMEWFWEIYLQYKEPRKRPENLCVHGYTDTGKTTFFDHFIPVVRELEQLNKYAIVQISCFTNTTARGIYHGTLDELEWPYSKQDNIQVLERQLKNATAKRGCRLIVIDEFSQVQSRNVVERDLVLQALRNIPIHTLCPLIIIGTPKVLSLLQKDVETDNRFWKVEFPRFKLEDGKWRIFQKFVASLDKSVNDTAGISSTCSTRKNVLESLFLTSKGKMGSLVKIYERTVKISLNQDKKTVNLTILRKAGELLMNNKLLADPRIPENWAEYAIPDKWWNT